jgi:hypothetical protein
MPKIKRKNVMKIFGISVLCMSACLSLSAQADESPDVETKKQAALEICIAEATEHYGPANASSKPKRKRFNNKKGYAVALKIPDSRKKKINCFASADGEVIFFRGSL